MKWAEIILKRLLLRLSSWLSTAEFESLTYHMVLRRTQALSPVESLRTLFRLDAKLYSLQGKRAIEYGNGIHPKHRLMAYHDFFCERIRAGERVLDVGCGIGAVAYDIAERSHAKVVAIDLDEANIETARRMHAHRDVDYRVGDVLKSLPKERFDVVVLSNVLEHLPARSSFLRSLKRAARARRYLIRVPLLERDWRVPLKLELNVESRLDPTHEIEYTPESFRSEMRAAGLRITHQQIHWGEIWAVVSPAKK